MSLKQFRNNEAKLQEQLFENIFLLTQKYPPSEEFKTHFRRDMFGKNNKTGFYQVVYYLLNNLNPQLTKQKLTSWPPYEIRLESKFRTELIQYINELNTIYKGANIPVLMTSHLISPGGVKFLKFMLKLSQLVMFEHLKKSGSSNELLVYNIKNTKCTSTTSTYMKNLKAITNSIEEQTKMAYINFQEEFSDLSQKAERLIEEKTNVNLKLANISKQYKKMQEDCKGNYTSPPLLEIRDKIDILRQELNKIKKIRDKFENLESLVSFLLSEWNVLNLGKDPSELPLGIKHIYNKNDEVFDFIEFLNSLQKHLDRSALHLPHIPAAYFTELKEKVDETNCKYSEMNKRADKLYEELTRIAEQKDQTFLPQDGNSLSRFGSIPKILIQMEDMYDLAMPLEDTPEGLQV